MKLFGWVGVDGFGAILVHLRARQYAVWHVREELKNKKDSLIKFYSQPGYKQRDRQTLNEIKSWPQPGNIPLETIKFSTEKTFALGTGFSIGRRLVVTAGHMVDDWTPEKVKNYRLVFGIYGGKGRRKAISTKQVFSIKRIIHWTNQEDSCDATDPTTDLLDLDVLAYNSNTYDFAILECAPPAGKKWAQTDPTNFRYQPEAYRELDGLVLDEKPATINQRVNTIGCAHGLELKHSVNGRVLDVPNKVFELEKQGTIKAAIDAFKGNSGGPLLRDGTDKVIGVVRSGLMHPYLQDSKQGVKITPQLQVDVQRWIRNCNGKSNKNVSWSFLSSFTELQPVPSMDGSTRTFDDLAWVRFREDSKAVKENEAYTRTEPYVLFSNQLSGFIPRSGRIIVAVELGLTRNPDRKLGIAVRGTEDNGIDEAIMIPPSTPSSTRFRKDRDVNLLWTIDLKKTLDKIKSQSRRGVNDMMSWRGGMCSWESLIVYGNPDQYGSSSFKPTKATVRATFQKVDRQSNIWKDLFTFTITDLLLRPVIALNGYTEWIAPIGLSAAKEKAPSWKGPSSNAIPFVESDIAP